MTAKKVQSKSAKAVSKGKTLADFGSVYDKSVIVPRKIREALAKMRRPEDEWKTDVEFIKFAGISVYDAQAYREMFAEFIVLIGPAGKQKRVWAGTKSLAAQMQSMVS